MIIAKATETLAATNNQYETYALRLDSYSKYNQEI